MARLPAFTLSPISHDYSISIAYVISSSAKRAMTAFSRRPIGHCDLQIPPPQSDVLRSFLPPHYHIKNSVSFFFLDDLNTKSWDTFCTP